MHKYLFLLIAIACSWGLLVAQTSSEPEKARFEWGVQYGFNLSNFDNSLLENCKDRVLADLLGGFAIRYTLSDVTAVRTELILDRVRSYIKSDHPYPYVFQSKSTFKSTRLKLPVCVEFRGAGKAPDVRPIFGIGGYMAIPLSADMKEDFDYQSGNTNTGYIDIKEDYPQFIPGVQIRLGINHKHSFWQIRYNHDLVSLKHPQLDVGSLQYHNVEFILGIIGLKGWLEDMSPSSRAGK